MATQFSGGTYVSTTFTGAVRSDIQSNLLAQLVTAGWTNKSLGTGQGPGNVGTFTITIASPGVVTFTTHGFLGGERVILQTTGALPTGLSTNTVYFVKYIDANTFNLSTTSGGSNINTSGSQSGTHTLNAESILLESATQANVTNPIRVRLKDNRGNCIQVSIENQAGTVLGGSSTTTGGNLLPAAAKTWRVIATKYHWLCFTPGASATREFAMAGMLYVPSFLTGITDHGFMWSNSWTDTDTTARNSFRVYPTKGSTNGTFNGNVQFIWNSNLLESDNTGQTGSACTGFPDTVLPCAPPEGSSGTWASTQRGYRWSNDDINTGDVFISAGITLFTDEGKLKGQLFDMQYIADAFAIDSTDTFSSHNWYNLTNNNSGSAGLAPRGGIWVATS